ncbi:MAG: alpha-hydroxy-acid oxidizing protein [Rhizobiales bacterium]|nr:alpha-hydroxy-acid oxidizing protein [Hyphomicrobiales bacterium]
MPAGLAGLLSIADMRRAARRTLPRPVFDLADGAAEDEWTLRRNEAAFGDVALLPKPLDGTPARDLSVTLFGHRLATPVMLGPTGMQGLFWPDGERCAARAAKAAGAGFVLSHASISTLEEVAGTGVSPRFMQVFIYRDRDFTWQFVDRAAAAGYEGLVLTVDNQFGGNRERDRRNGFTIPPRLGPVQVGAMAIKPGWLWRMRKALPGLSFANYVKDGVPIDFRKSNVAAMFDPGMSWADVEAMRKRWKGPFLLKGILHPDEARRAPDYGVDGIIVSNHGGRQLDGAASAIEALPAVVEAVGGRIPVLVDGGFRRGTDVLKALCLGASATLVGRPQLWGLSVAGEAGVAHVLEIFRSEIDRAMGLLGVRSLAELGPHYLAPVPR